MLPIIDKDKRIFLAIKESILHSSAQPKIQTELQLNHRELASLPALLTKRRKCILSFCSSLLLSQFPIHSLGTVLLCVKNGLELQQYCKGAMIKFVPTINVSVIGRGEGWEGWRRGCYRAINNQWWEGDLTPQSSTIVINITLASASSSQSVLLHLERVYSYINTLNK